MNNQKGLIVLTSESVERVQADLKFSCVMQDNEVINIASKTLMDFIDACEVSSEAIDALLTYRNVYAIFFNNLHNTKEFDTVKDLLEHCKTIIK